MPGARCCRFLHLDDPDKVFRSGFPNLRKHAWGHLAGPGRRFQHQWSQSGSHPLDVSSSNALGCTSYVTLQVAKSPIFLTLMPQRHINSIVT